MRVNDISFSEMLDLMVAKAVEQERYDLIPMMNTDGLELDGVWEKSTEEQRHEYDILRNEVWREHVQRIAKINELTA